MNLPLDFQLTTARFRLRAPSDADIPHIFSATLYAGFNDGMLWDPPATVEELQEPLRRNLEDWTLGRAFSFTIEMREASVFVGRVSIRPTLQPDLWDIGFWVHPTLQGQGFMKEAAGAVIDFGFERLSATAIESRHATWNVRSRRVLEHLGMTEVEYLAQGFKKRGEWVPEFRMRLDREQWTRNAPIPRVERGAT
jgi:ribosomal-protein-alanine N-acetyltransferase